MTKSVALLACDPGWKGLAFTLYVPCTGYVSTRLFQLNIDAKKGYKKPVNTIPLLVKAIREEYLELEPDLQLVDKIIIESQFRSNMQVLSYLILAVLQSVVPSARVELISALKCKRMFGVPLGDSHAENKRRMLRYVLDHKDELIGGETVTNHDTADSVILLNTFLKEKTRRLEYNIENVYEMSSGGVAIRCPTCGEEGAKIWKCNKAGPNQGKHFIKCENKTDEGKDCTFKWIGYQIPELEWDGEANCMPGKKSITGNKRKREPTKEPATKKPATAKSTKPAPVPVTKDEMLQLLVDMTRTIKAHIDEKFDEFGNRNNRNIDDDDSLIEASQEVPEDIE